MTDRNSTSARDLTGVVPAYTWRFGAPGERRADAPDDAVAPDQMEAEVRRLRARVHQLTVALEDVVAFALSSGDYKERAIMMHRRAVAALSVPPPRQPPAPARDP